AEFAVRIDSPVVIPVRPEEASKPQAETPSRRTPPLQERLGVTDERTHCGVIAVIGAPNAGKSTLVNQLVGQKVAITSAKAQTTRARLLGIALEGETQIILVDTPGIFAPKRRLDRAMVRAAWEGTVAARSEERRLGKGWRQE